MNQLLRDLDQMKTLDFWQEFLRNTKTTTETTESDDKNKMSTEFSLKPSFSSSSFFDIKTHPTVQDQVVLCRQIARQLVCDESNAKSKGREMFERRVQKSSKWVTTQTTDDGDDLCSEQSFHETTISDGPPNLKLVLDPRHVQDLESLDFEANEREFERHRERGQSQSRDIVSEVTSPDVKSKGNVLFAERLRKSSEWITEDVSPAEVPTLDTTTTSTTSTTVLTAFPPLLPQTASVLKYRDFNARARPFFSNYC